MIPLTSRSTEDYSESWKRSLKLFINKNWLGWTDGSVGNVTALQGGGPVFRTPRTYEKLLAPKTENSQRGQPRDHTDQTI